MSIRRTNTSSSLSGGSNNRSSSNITKTKQSGGSLRQQGSADVEPPLSVSVEDALPIPSLGAGWLPVSGAQQFRTLGKGPLYDPRTLPVIPAPFLIDLPTDNEVSPSVGDSCADAVYTPPAAPKYPKYRIADPLREASNTALSTDVDEEEDAPFSAPLPEIAGFSLHDILDKYRPSSPTQLGSSSEGDLSALHSQPSLADALGEDDKDNLITHAAVIAMVRLGRPKNVSEVDFRATVQNIRDVLLRQRALFPQAPLAPEGDAKGIKKKKSSAALGSSRSASIVASDSRDVDDDDATGGSGTVAVNNPRVAVVTYDDVLTKAAMELASRSGDKPPPALLAMASTTSMAPPTALAAGHDDPPTAFWSYNDVYLGAVRKVIKKTEALRKKQQLYIGYGRSVRFDKVEEMTGTMSDIPAPAGGQHAAGFGGHAPPSYRVDVAKNTSSVAALPSSLSTSQDMRERESLSKSENEGAATLEQGDDRILGTSPLMPTESVDTTPIIGDDPLGADESGPQLRQPPLSDSIVTESNHPSVAGSPAVPIGETGHSVVAIKSCGDPKSMKLLDKCEWTPEELTDAFDTVADGAAPTRLLSTDPLDWIARAKAAARGGRFHANQQPVQEVTSFRTTPQPSRTSAAPNLNIQRLASQRSAPPPAAGLIVTTSGSSTFGPVPISPLSETVVPSSATGASQLAISSLITDLVPSTTSPTAANTEKTTASVVSPPDDTLVTSQTSAEGRSTSIAPTSKPPAGKRQGSTPAAPTAAAAKATPKTERKKTVPIVPSAETTPASDDSCLATAVNPSVALASLFATADDDQLPHNLPPLTVVFTAFTVVSTLIPLSEEEGEARRFVCFQQLRPFYLRPPRSDEAAEDDVDSDASDEDEFWDDAVEELQHDMNDELLVPMTPPSTPVSWTPPGPETPFVPAPFTQMLIDRLEAGIATPKNSDDEESDEEGGGTAAAVTEDSTGGAPKRRVSEDGEVLPAKPTDEAIRTMQLQNDEVLRQKEAVRLEKLQSLRAMRGDHRPALSENGDGSGLDGTAWERTLERFLCVSKRNHASRGAPLLLSTRLPMRMEGTTSVVRRLMRRSKKDILALSKKSKQAQLVSFRPSRRFLAEVLRLRSFGPLVVALLSNPDDPLPEEAVSVSLEELGERLQHVWEGTPVDRQRRLLLANQTRPLAHEASQHWWSSLTDALRGLHLSAKHMQRSRNLYQHAPNGVAWRAVAGIGGGAQESSGAESHEARRVGSQQRSRRTMDAKQKGTRSCETNVDENILRRGTPHFLPQLTSSDSRVDSVTSGAMRLAQLRRAPRAADERNGLDPSYMDRPLEAQRFLRSAGGQGPGKKLFAAFRSSTPTSSAKKPQPHSTPQAPPPAQHQHHVYASHLYPLPVEVVGCVDRMVSQAALPLRSSLSVRQKQAVTLQQNGMRQLHELRFAELHDVSKLK
jgi:hypothetical protein